MGSNDPAIDYKAHILIGIRPSGIMTVIADWPHLPKQTEVQERIDRTRGDYVTFALCTPTSIMPALPKAAKDMPTRFGHLGRR